MTTGEAPYKGLLEHLAQATNGRVRIDPVTGDVGLGTPVQEPMFKVGNLVSLNGGDYPGLGQWFVQLWDGDEVAARVYGDDREAINRRVAALNNPPSARRTWVELSSEDKKIIRNNVGYDQFMTAGEYAHLVQEATEIKLKELNT
jgi:hypothetical protein